MSISEVQSFGPSAAAETTPLVETRGISKHYPGVQALRKVDFRIHAGEVRALLGVNGAGKSTLVKILSGVEHPDEGTIFIEGKPVTISTPRDAIGFGIATVFQELSIIAGLTVSENVTLGRWPRGKVPGTLNRRAMTRTAKEALGKLGIDLPLESEAGSLTLAKQQLVEVARALAHEGRLIVLDEPTSSLTAPESEMLIGLVRRLASAGIAVIFVSHRMQEIQQIADSITVMRDGVVVATVPAQGVQLSDVVEMMLGRRSADQAVVRQPPKSSVVLSIRGLSFADRVRHVSFDLHEGEVLGLAGLLGSGRSEVLRCIVGVLRADCGSILVGRKEIRRPTPKRMLRQGVGMTPEDRRAEGIVPFLTVRENFALTAWRLLSKWGIVSERKVSANAERLIESLDVAVPSATTPIANLSGGNQQKVVIGKWLGAQAKVLLLDEPTRGVDVRTKPQIYQLIRELCSRGIGIVYVSSEMEEMWEACDRLLVLNAGRVVAEMNIAEATMARVMELSMGAVSTNEHN